MRYSTLFEFKHSINWRESFVSGIAEGPLLDCQKRLDSLFRSHGLPLAVGGGISLFEAPEDANDFLHRSYFSAGIMNRRESMQ